MSASGKAGLPDRGRPASAVASAGMAGSAAHASATTGRMAAQARRQAMSLHGRAGLQEGLAHHMAAAPVSNPGTMVKEKDGLQSAPSSLSDELTAVNPGASISTARAASLARRRLMSSRGKAGIGGTDVSHARHLSGPDRSGRDISRAIREQRSKNGDSSRKPSRPCGRIRPSKNPVAGNTVINAAPVGHRGRDQNTGMESKKVTGDSVDRSPKVTGDESGMNRQLTGTRYMAASDTGHMPARVGASTTHGGSHVTGTMVGRHDSVTGDEAGSCRRITGDDYIGQEQFASFCKTTPAPQDQKTDASFADTGNMVTGTMTGRSDRVTGDEAGTCKAVTGTPYTSLDQAATYCEASEVAETEARKRPPAGTPGAIMTGRQPGVGGAMTGAEKGSCEPITGTPYIGADQFADACPATPADTASPDFPQPLEGAPWKQFSVTPPSGGAAHAEGSTGVTGNRYEARHDITGPFGMAGGKVTGTEEARFGGRMQSGQHRPVVAQQVDGRVKARITGEGQDAGLKITGSDWMRNQHVTGTEGRSATLRNPTIRMGMTDTMAVLQKRNEALPVPDSKVTGGSGNTDKGSLITYSGGARG